MPTVTQYCEGLLDDKSHAAPILLFPLVVDLDGTLTPADTLVESVLVLLKKSPRHLVFVVRSLVGGRASFKERIASRAFLVAESLPYREDFLEYLTVQKATGRRLILATAANHQIAQAVAQHLRLFDDVIASDGESNMKGITKLALIRQRVGDKFVYAGDSPADLPIWNASASAILVGRGTRLGEAVRRTTEIEAEFPDRLTRGRAWIRAMRLHQWLKNTLLFVPAFTAFTMTSLADIFLLITAFFAFSFLASATYILNDLWDLPNDRLHPRKRNRPFASGALSLIHGIAACCGLFLVSFALAWCVSPNFLGVLGVYLLITTTYSAVLKSYVLVDVLTLACLYAIRIIAGAITIGVVISDWLLVFSAFLFLSLALVKRCAELVTLQETSRRHTTGRDYRVSDLMVLWPLGVSAAVSSVVVFGLFIGSDETRSRYETPQFLWILALGLTYWLGRVWIKTSRGEMHDDPVVYAIKDRASLFVVGSMLVVTLVARFIDVPVPFLAD